MNCLIGLKVKCEGTTYVGRGTGRYSGGEKGRYGNN